MDHTLESAIHYSTWVEVDLGAIRENVAAFKGLNQSQVMAVVKANAYGHGMVAAARASLDGGATWLGVARIEEALDLRAALPDPPILVLGYVPLSRFDEAVASQISLTVWGVDQIQAAGAAGIRIGKNARLHIKLDTGMSRLGIQPEGAVELATLLLATSGVTFEGLFTHFARADEADPTPTEQQERAFQDVVQDLVAMGMRPAIVHAANSAAGLTSRRTRHDLLRAGIGIYGLHPSGECLLPERFRPALAWKAVLSQVKVVAPGRGVSYGSTYITNGYERIGTVPVGYADGFRRASGNRVLVGGRVVPVVGRVCMDQIMVQLDGIPDARAGDEVVLIGRLGEASITAEDVAQVWGTINYEVTSGIAYRVPRIYPPR